MKKIAHYLACTGAMVMVTAESNASSVFTDFSPLLGYNYRSDLVREWQDWLYSEKLDGIRAIWTGKTLVTRQGHRLNPPSWFVATLPDDTMLEGELWAGKHQFNHVMRTVLDEKPDEQAWRKIQFKLFDLPRYPGDFETRYQALMTLTDVISLPHVSVIQHKTISSEKDLYQQLKFISARGGEGVMLRKKNAIYQHGRDTSVLKVKQAQDDEAIVLGHIEGKGKYKGMLGALWVETRKGKRFKIGTGFSDKERHNPPALGAVITFRYNQYTVNGIPKFARYLREDKTKLRWDEQP